MAFSAIETKFSALRNATIAGKADNVTHRSAQA